ncbi:4922_t:CDS:2, partial [Dentiscutata erythropus]
KCNILSPVASVSAAASFSPVTTTSPGASFSPVTTMVNILHEGITVESKATFEFFIKMKASDRNNPRANNEDTAQKLVLADLNPIQGD